MVNQRTALIVGGGLTGLAAAALLRARGCETLVLDAGARLGGRFAPFEDGGARFDVPWAVDRGDSPIDKAFAEAGLAAPKRRSLALRIAAEGETSALETGSVSFVMKTKVGSLGTRMAIRGILGKSTRKEDRLDEFFQSEKMGSDGESILTALAGPAAAELGTMPSVAFALGREVLLEKRGIVGFEETMEQWVAALAEKAGPARSNCAVERIVVKEGRVEGVAIAGGEKLLASRVVLAIPTIGVRRLFSDEDWLLVSGDERSLLRSAIARPGLRVALKLERAVPQDFFGFLAAPPSWAVASGAIVTLDVGLPTADATREDAEPAGKAKIPPAAALTAAHRDLAANAEKSVTPLLGGIPVVSRSLLLRSVDDGWAALAGGRERPPLAVGGFDNLYLTGDATNAPYFGIERMFASALRVASLAS